jgi:hypothetical protein
MAGFNPNSAAGVTAYWNDRDGGGGHGARRAAAPGQSPEAQRVRALKAQMDAQRQAMIASIDSKVVRANAIGKPDESLIPMAELSKIGFSAQPTRDGIPYGIDPRSLTADERAFLGIPAAEAPPAPPQQAMIQELMRQRASQQQPPQGALASLYEGGQ